MRPHEREAIGLYAVAGHDPVDFLEMIVTADTEALMLLRDMLAHAGTSKTDKKLNASMLDPVKRQLAKRGVQ